MTQQAPLEERVYAAAVMKMLGHVGDCADCREAKCSKCSVVGFEHADADACLAAAEARRQKALDDAHRAAEKGLILAPVAAERDLTDPTTKLCPSGEELRAAAHEARLAMPSERLVAYWGLESPDVPPDDRWDSTRGAEWVRSDLVRARKMLEQIEERKGITLEGVDEDQQALRVAFLKGFRSVCPGPGRPPTEEELAARRVAVERIVAAISERFVRRFRGVLPHPTAVEAFRRGHDLVHDWVVFAAGVESVRLRKAVLWGQAAPKGTEPGGVEEQVEEMRKLARWAAERFAEMAQEQG
jgi:hypothetical protein